MKHLTTIISSLFFVTLTYAQQPDWVPLLDILDSVLDESNPDVSKEIYVYQRCAGHQLAMAAIVEESSDELARQYSANADILGKAASWKRALLAMERNPNYDSGKIGQATGQAVIQFTEQYKSWLNYNYLNQGSYYENDIYFQGEMQLCSGVTGLADAKIKIIEKQYGLDQ